MTLTFKRFCISALILLMIFVINIPFIATGVIERTARSRIVEVTDAPPMPVAVVLGAAAYNPALLSPILEDRMKTALELYRLGKVKKLILSGAANEVIAMANYALAAGVPPLDILGDQNGYNTFASLSHLADDYPQMIIVTQRYHLPRALFYARYFDIDSIGVPSDLRVYDKIDSFRKRERLAHSKAFLDVYLFSWLLSDERLMTLNKRVSDLD